MVMPPRYQMKHGWVVRGDTREAAINRDVVAAVDATAAFFKLHLSPPLLPAPEPSAP